MQDKYNRSNNNTGCRQGCLVVTAGLLSFGVFVIGLLAGVLLIYRTRQPEPIATLSSTPSPTPLRRAVATIFIDVSGQGNTITILEGNQEIDSGNLNFTGQGQSFNLYVPVETKIRLSLSGQANIVYISRQVAEGLQIVSQSGQSNQVLTLDR